jgi:hypothetical protein
VQVGISLPDATHARALEYARSAGTTLSGLIDVALQAELTRREVADHIAMLTKPTMWTDCVSGLGHAAEPVGVEADTTSTTPPCASTSTLWRPGG